MCYNGKICILLSVASLCQQRSKSIDNYERQYLQSLVVITDYTSHDNMFYVLEALMKESQNNTF